MSTFHLFPLLPAEIRSAIYILATPPRVVQLHQQVESFEDFNERLPHMTISERNLRPNLDYSSIYELIRQTSAILGRHRRIFFKQTKLEAYGFTTNKRACFSWELESIMPFDVLMGIPALAFCLYWKATVSCQAAIPPLLHTCSESRFLLIKYGYQLSFPSTAQEPRTWFNFKRDVLFLDDEFNCRDVKLYGVDQAEIGIISHTFHQFRPQDAARIQWLALGKSTHPDRIFLGHKLYPELKELILVEWSANESEQALHQSIVDPKILRPTPDYMEGHLCLLPIEESDALWTTLELDVFGDRNDWFHEGTEDARHLKQHKLANGFHSPFIEDKLRHMREQYEQNKEEIEQFNKEYWNPYRRFTQRCEEFPPWSIQQTRFAHICTSYAAGRIVENRSKFIEQFTKLKEEAAQEKAGNDLSWIKQHKLPHPFVLQRYSNWSATDESMHSIELEWWIKNGLPALGNSLTV